ncbi:MAG: hypothetical protein U0176_19685 [Bacteroidia bacterium]
MLLGIWASTPLTDRYQGADSDGRQYVAMAGDSMMFGSNFARYAPFAYRVATPWVAKQIPGRDVIAKFKVLAWIDAAMMLLLCFVLFQALGFSPWDSLIGMGLYGLSFWTLKFAFYSPCYIDHQSQVIVLAILVVMAKGWWPFLPIIVFAGYFQKESVVAVIPVILAFYVSNKGWKWWPTYVIGALSVSAAVIAGLILRNNVHPINLELASPLYAMEDSWAVITHTPGYPRILVVAIFSCMGVMPLLVLGQLRWALRYLQRNPAWLAMTGVGLVFLLGGLDKSRLFLHMLPAVTVVSVAIISDLRRQLSPTRFRMWVGFLFLIHAFLGAHLEPFRDFMNYLNRMVPEHSPNQGAEGFTRVFFACVIYLVGDLVIRWRKNPGGLETSQ